MTLAALAVAIATAAAPAAARPGEAPAWVGAWASAQQLPEPQNALAPADLADATLRQVVHLSAGGVRLRVRVSNAFGTQPLIVSDAHVARAAGPGSAAVRAGTDRRLTFGGEAQVVIPAGAEYWSDPAALSVAPGADLAVSLYLPAAPERQTSHPGSHATSFLVHGDRTAASDLPDARRVEHWFQLSGVDVQAGAEAGALVALGDSITDGHGSTPDRNDRWPDDLARRLQAAGRRLSVLNLGIGGNRMLRDGLGPNALARFDRDVLAQSGVRTLILLEGVNDLGVLTHDAPATPEQHRAMVRDVIAAYGQIILQAHARGVKAIGATVTPFMGSGYYHPDAANEADRQALNAWIRTPGRFDAVIDFDAAVRDLAHPDRLRPAFDSGDHLHPSPAGYRAMAAAVPLQTLAALSQ